MTTLMMVNTKRVPVHLKAALALACAACFLLLAPRVDLVAGTKFNDLTDDQQDEVIAALNDELFKTELDPLSLILEGLQKARGNRAASGGAHTMAELANNGHGNEPTNKAGGFDNSDDDDDDDDDDDHVAMARSPSSTGDHDHMMSAADNSHSNLDMNVNPGGNAHMSNPAAISAENDHFLAHLPTFPLNSPSVFSKSSHKHHSKIESHVSTDGPDGKHEEHFVDETGTPFDSSKRPTSVTPIEPIEPDDFDDFAGPHGGHQGTSGPFGSTGGPIPASPLPVSNRFDALPADEDSYEDSYIDNSNPNDPKQVHVENRNWSKAGPNGFAQERTESKTSTSLNNPNSYSHHHQSSSISSSSSSFSKTNSRKHNNWQNHKNKKWTDPSKASRVAAAAAYAPPLLPIPLMPYGLPVAGAWPGYYPGQEYADNGYGAAGMGYHPAAGGAYAAAAAAAYGGYPPAAMGDYYSRQNQQPIRRSNRSKKSEKRRRRRANAAMRRANAMNRGRDDMLEHH